jgi:hypothetical protein
VVPRGRPWVPELRVREALMECLLPKTHSLGEDMVRTSGGATCGGDGGASDPSQPPAMELPRTRHETTAPPSS